MKRFQDNGERSYGFGDYLIVECPSCIKPIDLTENAKLSCIHCGYSKTLKEEES